MARKYHLRSISFPSRSHPSTLRIEDQLNRFKTWESSPSCLLTYEWICAGLSGLEDLYQCMDDLLNIASTQQVISKHQNEKCIEELLDGSLMILDICGIARDYMFEIKEHVHALQSAVRRRKGDSSVENHVLSYSQFRKEKKKKVKKLISEMKQMHNKNGAAPQLQDQDHHFSAVIQVLREVNAMNISIFQALFSFLVSSKQTTTWSLVSKLLHKGVVSCEENNVNELESIDVTLCGCNCDVEKMQIVHKRLVSLESSIECLENRLECVFRHLIKTRTSLLNIISA